MAVPLAPFLNCLCCCLFLLWKRLETKAHNLGTVDDVHKGLWVETAQVGTEFYKVGTLHGDVNHLAFGAVVKTFTGKTGAATLQIVQDVVAHCINLIGDDECRFVALGAINNQVDDFSFDEDDDDRVDWQTEVAKCDQGGQGDATVNNHDERTQGNLCVFVQNHGNDVATARSSTGTENHTNSDTIDEASNHRVQEIVGREETAIVDDLYHGIGNLFGHDSTIVDDGSITPCCF